MISIFTLIILIFISFDKFDYKNFPFGKEKKIIKPIRQKNGLVISSIGVQGYENFNILSYSGRPHYIASQKLIKVSDDVFIDVYCNSIYQNKYKNKLEQQRKCFSHRSPELWKYIGKYLGATSIIVHSSISVNLPKIVGTKNFNLYNISLTSKSFNQNL